MKRNLFVLAVLCPTPLVCFGVRMSVLDKTLKTMFKQDSSCLEVARKNREELEHLKCLEKEAARRNNFSVLVQRAGALELQSKYVKPVFDSGRKRGSRVWNGKFMGSNQRGYQSKKGSTGRGK